MSWSASFRVRQYVTGSLWVIPLLGGIVGVLLSYGAVWVESSGDLPAAWTYKPDTALTVLTTVVGATVGLTGFVVTVSVLVVQMATGTFSARYMRLWYRDGILKAVLAVLIGTFMFSYALIRHVENANSVPNLGVSACGLFLGAGLVLFLVFLDRFVHRLRPVKVAALVAKAGRASMRNAARRASSPGHHADDEIRSLLEGTAVLRARSDRAGAIQAIDERGLVAWARENDCALVLPHAVGVFVSSGATLVEAYGPKTPPAGAGRRLGSTFALGDERTIEQDPAFALRILVDVAIRALSPAVNDPTTAIQVLDHLEDTLALIGTTPGLVGRWEFNDDDGKLRLVVPAQRWADYLELGVTEIRDFGITSIQVVRRLRAMLLELRTTVLPEYADDVDRELARLEHAAEAAFGASEDAETARATDRQGIGGPRALA